MRSLRWAFLSTPSLGAAAAFGSSKVTAPTSPACRRVRLKRLALVASPAAIGVQALASPTRTALDKLAAAVPSMHQLRAQHARGRLLFDTKPWFRSLDTSPFLDNLRTCIWKDQCVDLRYERSDGEVRDYRLEPYALVVKVDTWYVIGRVKREMRVFRMSRVQTAQECTETFTRDADFDLHKYWHGWCERFEKNPPNTFSVELSITPKGRKHLLECYGNWFRKQLEPLGEKFRRPTSSSNSIVKTSPCESCSVSAGRRRSSNPNLAAQARCAGRGSCRRHALTNCLAGKPRDFSKTNRTK